VFLAVQILTPLFSLTVLNFVVFFYGLDGKFNEDSKNVLKTDIFPCQVSFTGDYFSFTVLSNCVSGSSNFDTPFLSDCTKFCNAFYGIR